jgi:hypothetical protein
MSEKFTLRHFMALDQAVAEGITIEHGGKTYTLSPLTFRDLGAIVAEARSIALRAYFVWFLGATGTRQHG